MASSGMQSHPRIKWDLPANVFHIPESLTASHSSEAVLELACFVKPPTLSFERVKVGTTCVKTLKIVNPGTERETVILEKFPSAETGLAIVSPCEENSSTFNLEPQEETKITISWHPLVAGSSRHLVTFKWLGAQKLQVVLLVSSYDPNERKNKAKRFGNRKVLRPTQRQNILEKKAPKKNEKFFCNYRHIHPDIGSGYKSPSEDKLMDAAPDTPSRRATFNVVQPTLGMKQEVEDYKEGKENKEPVLESENTARATFMVGKNTDLKEDSKKCLSSNPDKKQSKTEVQKKCFEGLNNIAQKRKTNESAFDENSVMIGNTFHESEIRLSSSPIKWYERSKISLHSNNDLHPGQVVMNGEVKHAFIPYPSFDNTDTFWNMEMSTANKHKLPPQDESLSFGSAASSLFTITREEKFSSVLEPVNKSTSVYATPIGGQLNSVTTVSTNTGDEICEETLVVNNEARKENGTFCIEDNKNANESQDKRDMVAKWGDCGDHGNHLEPSEKAAAGKEGRNVNTELKKAPTPVRENAEPWHCENINCEVTQNKDECIEDDETIKVLEVSTKETESFEELDKNRMAKISAKADIAESSIGDDAESVVDRKQIKASIDLQKNLMKMSNVAKKKIRSTNVHQSKELCSSLQKQREKAMQPRDLAVQRKPKESALRQSKDTPKSKGKLERQVADTKFKAFSLPRKRPNDAGPRATTTVKPSIAVKKLKLEKPKQGKIAKHPMPYAAKNMFYDERWIEKQETGFKNWLNFVLTAPDDGEDLASEEKRGKLALESDSNQPVAPTKEVLSFRMYAARRRMAKLRRDACSLYQCDQLATVIQKLEREIEHGRLAIRTDRQVDADLGVRKHIADMLLSFNPLWLRIGLEVVYGEIIPMPSSERVALLSRFIHRRLLGNPDIAEEYSHPSVPGLFKPGYVEALGKFTLKKLLLLVIFLDKAKNARLMSHDPCLFNKDSQFKSTRDMLLMFSRDYLHREGDIVKHLTYLGYAVSHVQTPLHEFDFGVNSLAVDLRDGMRLVRVVELLTKNWNLSTRLRIPAVSRLQKVHNVELALTGLKEANLDIKNGASIDARFIVDGHREKTLVLLWNIIFHFQVDVLLDDLKLREEIAYLEKSNRLIQAYRNFERDNPALEIQPESFGKDLNLHSDKLSLLLKWCRLVGQLHGVQIENFTVSFSDGRALCYLLHHYHPALLPKDAIHDDTSVTCSISKEDDHDIDDNLIYQNWIKPRGPGDLTNTNLTMLLLNEKKNFGLFCEKVKEIGPSPAMILTSDMSNTIPDEKVVVVFLSFLCSRLLDLREEIRAARCIQLAWRHHQLKKKQSKFQIQIRAVIKLQSVARGFLERKRRGKMEQAAVKIQALWRGYTVRRKLLHDRELNELGEREAAAAKIQAVVRGFISRNNLRKKRMAALLLQKNVRIYLLEKSKRLQEEAAIIIQRRFRESSLARTERFFYLRKREATLKIQRVWKTYRTRKVFLEMRNAAISIQKYWRTYLCRKRYKNVMKSVITLQAHWRAHLTATRARNEFLSKRASIIVLQRAFRDFLAKQREQREHACLCIQAYFRGYKCRKWYSQLRRSVIKVQAITRRKICQRDYRKLRANIISLQRIRKAVLLGRQARKDFKKQREACSVLQAAYRGKKARKVFLEMKASAVQVQSLWRGKMLRKRYHAVKHAVLVIEAALVAKKHMQLQRAEFQLIRTSSVKIQATFRAYRQRKCFLQLRLGAVQMQALYRSNVQRKQFLSIRNAATKIQRRFRATKVGEVDRRKYTKLKSSCVFIQSLYRCKRAKRSYQKLKSAALTIQRRYHAMKLSQAAQVHFLITRAAIISIQSAYRGYATRKELQMRHSAAQKIQALVRMHKAKREYSRLKKAAAAMRGFAVRKAIRKTKLAALRIQAVYRGYRERKRYRVIQRAVLTVQKNVRAHLVRKEYLHIKTATIKVQRLYRGYRQTRAAVEEYQKKLVLVIKIQTAIRGFLATRTLHKNKAARKVQAAMKGFVERKKYRNLKSLVVKLQRNVRFKIETKHREKAATSIQLRWKEYRIARLQRCQFIEMRQSCVTLQSLVRKWINRRNFLLTKEATLVIQRRYRAQKEMKVSRNMFTKTRQRAIQIQAAYRMHCAKKEYRAKREAIILLQRRLREVLVIRKLKRLVKAALAIQCWFRATSMMRSQRHEFLLAKSSAVTLQSNFRAMRARKIYLSSRKAAVKIQSWYRMAVARRNFLRKKSAALVIQRRYRACVACQEHSVFYHFMRGAAITIQASIKGFLARKQYLQKKKSARIIQSVFRKYIAQKSYMTLRQTAILLQRRVRANLVMRAHRQNFLRKKSSAIVIQRAFRKFTRTKKAVVIVQSTYRMLKQRRMFIKMRNSCIIIQRWFGQCLERKKAAIKLQSLGRMIIFRRLYREKIEACIKLQSVFRMHFARKRYSLQQQAIAVIQRRYRAHVTGAMQRQKYLMKRQSCRVIQSVVRMWLSRSRFLKLKHSTCIIQEHQKAYSAMKKQRTKFLALKAAVVVIQASYRGFKTRVYTDMLRKKKLLESHLKQIIEQRVLSNRQRAATMVQKNFRRFIAQKKFILLKQSSVRIQRFYRGYLLTARVRSEYEDKRLKVQIIQRAYRSHLAKRQLLVLKEEKEKLNKAAAHIQAMFKCFVARKEFVKRKNAASTIQRCFKCMLLSRRVRNEYLHLKTCAVTIQLAYRSYAIRNSLEKLITDRKRRQRAAAAIQAAFRGYVIRKEFQRLKKATLFAQSFYRSARLTKSARVNYIHMKWAVVRIQTAYRKCRAELHLRAARRKELEDNVIRIQRKFRAHRDMVRCRIEFQNLRSAAIIIQHAYRAFRQRKLAARKAAAMRIQTVFRAFRQRKCREERWAAAVVIQRWYHSTTLMKEERAKYLGLREAVLCIQKCWRGYLVRRSIVDQKVILARERINSATSEATEPKKLCNRTKSALSYLLNCRNVTTIYEALRNLEVATRLSVKCCERLVEDNALTVIFQIMRNCNRSLPSIEQINMALLVLINVSKCPTTYMAIVEDGDFLQQITEIMVNFREKKKIFPPCCRLLSILCQDASVSKLLRNSEVQLKKIKGLYSLIGRKAEIEQKRKNSKILTKGVSSKEGRESLTIQLQECRDDNLECTGKSIGNGHLCFIADRDKDELAFVDDSAVVFEVL
eukprot:gene10190-18862_t